MKIESISFTIPLDQIICHLMNLNPGVSYDVIETWLRDNYEVHKEDYIQVDGTLRERSEEDKKKGRKIF